MKLTLLPLQKDDVIRVRCDGPVSRQEGRDPLQDLLGPHCYGHRVLLSLERSQAVHTSGISWLMRSQKQFQEAGGKLVICAVPPVVADVLTFLRLTPMLNIAATEHAGCDLVLDSPKAPENSSLGNPIPFPR